MSDDIIKGRINIFKTRIRTSPGKLMSIIECEEKFTNRPRNPRIKPNKTAAIVSTNTKFSPIHFII